MNTQSPANPADDRLLTEKEAADYLRIKVRQLYNWRVSGLIPYIRIGKALRYRKAAVDQALERFTRGPVC
jgi:excisionase family DNA binding protein